MRVLEALSDGAIAKLAIATNVARPALPRGLDAPRFWEAFADLVAAEVARRAGMDVAEPPFPELAAEELEGGAFALCAMADADPDPRLSEVLRTIAAGLLKLRAMAESALN